VADDALLQWLNDGAPTAPSLGEAIADRRRVFARRFLAAMKPEGDMGSTEESHEMAIAQHVLEISDELCALGEDEMMAVWWTFQASERRALNVYLRMARKEASKCHRV
jgi:hypothetical protein